MHSRLVSLEDGKDPATTAVKMILSRPLPVKLLQIFVLFLVLGLGLVIISLNTLRYFGKRYEAPMARISVQSSFKEANSLESWIKPLSNLWHNMSDTELFWGASFVPRRKEYPFKRVPKIAFMFLTKGPLPLASLWEKFFQGNDGLYSIYIHPHPSYVCKYTDTSVFHNRQIPSQLAEWGRMSMCSGGPREFK